MRFEGLRGVESLEQQQFLVIVNILEAETATIHIDTTNMMRIMRMSEKTCRMTRRHMLYDLSRNSRVCDDLQEKTHIRTPTHDMRCNSDSQRVRRYIAKSVHVRRAVRAVQRLGLVAVF